MSALPPEADIDRGGHVRLVPILLQKWSEEESGRWLRAKLSLPLAHESGGGDYSTHFQRDFGVT